MERNTLHGYLTKYMTFKLMELKAKTDVWHVLNNRSGGLLGIIQWYGPWRQYCLFPEPDCVFNNTCLADITAFMLELKGKP